MRDEVIINSLRHKSKGFLREVFDVICKHYGQLRGMQFKNFLTEARQVIDKKKFKIINVDIMFSKYILPLHTL